jgi:hypothetical protein
MQTRQRHPAKVALPDQVALPDKVVSPARKAFKVAVLFVISYALSVALWMPVCNNYGLLILNLSSSLLQVFRDVEVRMISADGSRAEITIICGENIPVNRRLKTGEGKRTMVELAVDMSALTNSVPATIAVMAVFFPILKNSAEFKNGGVGGKNGGFRLALFYLKLPAIFFALDIIIGCLVINKNLSILSGAGSLGNASNLCLVYMGGFMEDYVKRAEPFILGLYMYLRMSSRH